MRKDSTSVGHYKRIKEAARENTVLYCGRDNINCSADKYEEYFKLRWFICTGEVIPYGYLLPLYRFYKNMKYRKQWIKIFKKFHNQA